jgi:signal transduction histidine kinase
VGSYGTGVGLVGALRFIEQHGGTIDIDSREGIGTKVTVRIPAGVSSPLS